MSEKDEKPRIEINVEKAKFPCLDLYLSRPFFLLKRFFTWMKMLSAFSLAFLQRASCATVLYDPSREVETSTIIPFITLSELSDVEAAISTLDKTAFCIDVLLNAPGNVRRNPMCNHLPIKSTHTL